MNEYIRLPVDFKGENKDEIIKESGEPESGIDNIIDLIVFTPKGSFIADPEFGFEYWNHEFTNINVREFNNSYIGFLSSSQFFNEVSRKQCETSLRESIIAYEPRLINPDVKIELEVNEKFRRKKYQSKYEIKIIITGKIDAGLGIEKNYEKKITFFTEPIAKKL